jgi:LysR family hydrogen peroxide-inducible transcriptional activator
MNILSQHLEKLVAFEAACRHGTIQSAAIELRLTQPSVSRSLQTLEKALNTRLLVKGRKGVQPTDAGVKLLAYANEVLRGARDVAKILQAKSTELSGMITIGTYESLAEYLWPDFMLDLRDQCPYLNINLKTNSEKEHYRSLEDGSVDMVVDAEPKQKEGFVSWELYTDQFSLYVQSKKPRIKGTHLDVRSLPLIYVPHAKDRTGKSLRSLIEQKHNDLFQQEIQLDSFSTVKRFVCKGVGVGALPLRLAIQELNKKEIEPFNSAVSGLKLAFGEHRICATVLDKRSGDFRLKAIVDLLRKFLKSKQMV